MSQLVETLKCRDGLLVNLPYHLERLNRTRRELFGPCRDIRIDDTGLVPESAGKGVFKCRILYTKEIEAVEFHPYRYRNINSLRIIESDTIHYPYKFTDRNALLELFTRRGSCDDILIVKNGLVTDSYMANVLFYDGFRWWTPDSPLLPGTQRARLIDEGKLAVAKITRTDIAGFRKAGLINAMHDLDEMPAIAIRNIVGI